MDTADSIIAYHGTLLKETAEKILEEGFQPGTYFTPFMDSALVMGGQHLFEVFLPKGEYPLYGKHWQYICQVHVPKKRIVSLRVFEQTPLYISEDAEFDMKKHRCKEDGLTACEKCRGRGQLEHYGKYASQWHRNLPVTSCPECGGFGSIDHPTLLSNRAIAASNS